LFCVEESDGQTLDLLSSDEKREVRMTHFRRVVIIAGSAVISAAVLLLVPVFCCPACRRDFHFQGWNRGCGRGDSFDCRGRTVENLGDAPGV
jgi:hypothetical protein